MGKKMYGYSGKILRISLDKKKFFKFEDLSKEFPKKYIGGLGFGAKIIYDEVPGEIDAFDPRNLMVFSIGPLTASPWPSSADYVVCSKSPLVCNPDTLISAWGDGEAKGYFGPKMKSAGYDAIVITGKSPQPCYIYVNETSVELRDASCLWGKGTYETHDILFKDFGKKVAVACIGPAGERLVRFACIMSTPDHYIGRCGLGAVMGSKNLKAIVVDGDRKVEIADPDNLKELIREVLPRIFNHGHTKEIIYATTAGSIQACDNIGDLPVMNWRGGKWTEGAEKISGFAMNKRWGRGRRFCKPYCTIGCKRDIKFQEAYGPVKPFIAAGPEYETCALLGSMNLCDDINAIVAGNHLCNDLGIDTISAGGTASFAFECFEKGALTKKDLGGLELNWRDGEALVHLLLMIGNREGIGDLLAEGSFRASKKIKKGSEEWCIEVKGAELPGHDPRALDAWAINYAVSLKGASHLDSYSAIYETIYDADVPGYLATAEADESIGIPVMLPRDKIQGKGRAAGLGQNLRTFVSSLGICLMAMLGIKFQDYCRAFNYVTGLNLANKDIMKCLDRITTLRRAFNNKCGLTAKHDYLPKRLTSLPRDSGLSKGRLPDIKPMLKEYYDFRGWDPKTGKPKKDRLIELDLTNVVNQLYR
jgi:aldehyde:ferredoxin oxidoreductase